MKRITVLMLLSVVLIQAIRASSPIYADNRFNTIFVHEDGGLRGGRGRIIGQLADIMAQKLHFTDTVYVNYWTNSTNHSIRVENHWRNKSEKCLIVTMVDGMVDVVGFLKLIEYGMTHKDEIKNMQDSIGSEASGFSSLHIREIILRRENKITETLAASPSALLTEVLSYRVSWLKPEKYDGETCFFQHGKYHVISRWTDPGEPERVIGSFESLHQFLCVPYAGTCYFDTDSSFYFLSTSCERVSDRHAIPGVSGQNLKFRAGFIGGDRIFLSYPDVTKWSLPTKNGDSLIGEDPCRYMLYKYLMDELIIDLDEALYGPHKPLINNIKSN